MFDRGMAEREGGGGGWVSGWLGDPGHCSSHQGQG